MILIILILQIFEYQGYDTSYFGASPLNSDWDGTSELLNIIYLNTFNVNIVTNWMDMIALKNILSCKNKLLVVISPEKSYTYLDIITIKSIFKENFSILIADEGPYSNFILEALNIPIAIDSLNFININNSYIVNGTISIDNREFQIWFAYASPLKIYNYNVCKPIAFISNYIVGVECNIDKNISAIIFGDGSIFINSVLRERSIYNPYRQIVIEIMRKLLLNEHTCVFVEASKYWLRLMSIDELLKQNVSSDKIIVSLVRPIRYLASSIKNLNDVFLFPSHGTSIFIFVIIFAIIIVLLNLNKIKMEYRSGVIEKETIIRPSIWEITKRICRYIKDCPSECKAQKLSITSRKRCLNYINNINNYELDKKISLLIQLILD
ncbi:hypothetical protein Igag_1488 [Ignisphaera aggregans DSM 17230]|uniref:DUF4350 domain-containing protein n=1 Tax=Ignisphaera aggregans (strain DSM 17230 / JCM 13409 / AQ1.S1) TaxID=583356 RepID=E0SQW0_IGNAA|nr:hypothetical protein Igag_1488 [Ignisphaera aggregans DSM 17230]